MKKVLSIALLVALIVLSVATIANAATPSEELYAYASKTFSIAGKEVKLASDADLVKVQRYLSSHEITEEQYQTVKAEIDKVVAVMDKEGVTDVTKLTGDAEASVKSYVSTAAAALDLTVSYNYKDQSISVYDLDGTLVEEYSASSVIKLQQTGSSNYGYAAVAVVAIIAVAILVKSRKVAVNA